MVFRFDLQLFGGGESSTTHREIPEQTANEKALERFLLDGGSLGGNMAPYAYQAFAGSLNDVFTPNFNDLYDEYVRRTDGNNKAYTEYLTKNLNDYRDATDEYWRLMNNARGDYEGRVGALNAEYNRRMDNYLSDYAGKEDSALSDLEGKENRYLGDYTNRERSALGQYEAAAGGHLGQYENALDRARSSYEEAAGKRSGAWDDLVNGVLPSAYASNRQAALNSDLRGTMGSAINDLANRGIINSSVSNKALGDIAQSSADTLARMYNTDLNTEAALLGQDRSNVRSDYDVAAGNAGSVYGAQSAADNNLYGNRTGTARNVYGNQTGSARTIFTNTVDSARNVYGNQANNANAQYSNLGDSYQKLYQTSADAYNNAMNQYANMYKERAGQANNWLSNVNQSNNDLLQGAINGQTASMSVPSQYLSYAGQLTTPVSNLYNTMYSGRMGTGSTTTSTDDGGAGMWSAVGGLGSAMILCFHGNTLVTTPKGYKAIRDVKPGDEVLSLHEGEVVTKKVKSVTEPHKCLVVDVYWDNGTVWHVTPGQRYFDGKHFIYIGNKHIPAVVHGGEPTKLLKVEPSGKMELVYDITLEGFAGENVFFANDVAAEGFGD